MVSNLKQRSEEWFAARKGRITASLVGGLLGEAPYMSKDDAFRALVRSVHDLPSEFKGNIATEYGVNNEPLAVAAYEMETGNTVEATGLHPFAEWAGASPDGLIGEDGLLEVKCPFGKRDTNPPDFKSIDDQPHYYGQIQFQLFCLGRSWCDFFQWSRHGTKIERVKYDGGWINDNIPRLLEVWEAAKIADPADYDGEKRPVFDTPEAVRLVAEYDELSEAIENANARKKDIIARLVDISGERNAIMAGRNLTLVERKGSVSYAKALAKYAPDADLEPFRGKPSKSWQIK